MILSDIDRDRLLIKVSTQIESITEDVAEIKRGHTKLIDQAVSPEGFARCVMHRNDIVKINKSITWITRTALGAVVIAVIGLIVRTIWAGCV